MMKGEVGKLGLSLVSGVQTVLFLQAFESLTAHCLSKLSSSRQSRQSLSIIATFAKDKDQNLFDHSVE